MKKIFVTRKLLKENEDKLKSLFDVNLNINLHLKLNRNLNLNLTLHVNLEQS